VLASMREEVVWFDSWFGGWKVENAARNIKFPVGHARPADLHSYIKFTGIAFRD
jgi:hypothetical protein